MNEKAIFDLVDIYIKQMHKRLYRKSEENLLHKPCFLSILSKPDELCFFIKELVNACENTSEIAYIAAGPLEELIHKKRLYRICCAIEMRVNNGYNRFIKHIFHKKTPENGQYFTSTRYRFT